MEDGQTQVPEGPMVQIMPVENGFLITAYNGKGEKGQGQIADFMSIALSSMQSGEDPMAALKKSQDQAQLKNSVKRKAIEYHVAKNAEETLKLVGEILGTMKI